AQTIINPSAKTEIENTASAGISAKQDRLFEKVADFARSMKEQVVVRQVLENVENSLNAVKVNEIKMVLKPENLGNVYIKLEHRDNEIKGTVTVTNNDVKEILKAGLPELKQTLASIGLNADSFDVLVADGRAGDNRGNYSNQFTAWEGAAVGNNAIINDSVDSFINVDGYLNYLA
ncbi:MAG: flagellar hook-length control protein FliK, partial [Spirochaetia bacterium]|nr:flagellar hook-length control protein FliK [Spirochaetia bacterium]